MPCFHARVRNADYPLLTPQELATTGQALFGSGWRAALAHAFGVSQAEITAVESGKKAAPEHWRAQLIALAQSMALRALDAANNLIWREEAAETSQQPPRFA
jgi:hypothetical protein